MRKTYKKIGNGNRYIEQKAEDILTVADTILEAPTFPWRKIGRIALIVGIVHVTLLVMIFTGIMTVRYGIQL